MTEATMETTEKLVEEEFLSAEQILAEPDVDYRIVDCPEWKTKIRLRTMTGAEAIQFAMSLKNEKLKNTAMYRIIAMTAVDPKGSRLFKTDEQVERLQGRSMRVLQRLQVAALQHNGYAVKTDEHGAAVPTPIAEAKND